MMKKLLFLILCAPFICIAQEGNPGILFENSLNWQQILLKAKAENKFIFVDCFATWCGPCKQMDKEVFSSKNVGAFFNERFISVKLQMDTTAHDNDHTRRQYDFAANFASQHKVKAFPTYLFFSPNGKIVDKYIGSLKEGDFITLANNSLNPEKQYYTLLDNYKMGKKIIR